MSDRRTFEVEPWSLREASLDLDVLAQTESVFALANGHIGLRANLDEGEPYGLPDLLRKGPDPPSVRRPGHQHPVHLARPHDGAQRGYLLGCGVSRR